MFTKKKLIVCILLLLASFFVFSIASAVDAISIKYKFDKDSYELGEEITVKYEITGGSGEYPTIIYDCNGNDNGTLVKYTDGSLDSAKGKIVFSPKIGQTAYVQIYGFDSDGRFFNNKSDSVELTGGQDVDPIEVKITFEQDAYLLGNEITAKYIITGGSGDYPTILYDCNGSDNGTLVQIADGSLNSAKGKIVFTPKVGQTAYIRIDGFDSDGRFFNVKSDVVKLLTKEEISTTVKGGKYELDAELKNAIFVGPKKKSSKSLTIMDTVTIDEKEYKVTEIKADAGKGMTKLATLTIGKNVKTIGAGAFSDCKKGKAITITGTALKKIGENAFSGWAKKVTVTANKKVLTKYVKLLQKAGLSGKITKKKLK